jgi:hypothetical protein
MRQIIDYQKIDRKIDNLWQALSFIDDDILWLIAVGENNNMDYKRLTDAVEAAAATMVEASADIRWLKDNPVIKEVVKEDPEAAAKLDELANKLEAAAGSLKVDTDATNPPEVVEPLVVEEVEPEPAVEVPTEEVQPVVEETPAE